MVDSAPDGGGSPPTGPTNAGSNAPKKAGSGLSKKVGPLPIWAWVAVVVGSYILYKYIRSRSGASTATASTAGGTVGASNGASSLLGSQGFSINPSGQIVDNATGDIVGNGSSGSAGGGSTSSLSTAAQWVANAESALQGLGYDQSAVANALQLYSSGQPLDPTSYGIIESAINQVGSAPAPFGSPTQTPAGGSAGTPTTPSSTAPQTAPTPSIALPAGENFTSAAYNPLSGTWDFLTNLGGLYTLDNNGNPTTAGGFYGTYLSLPAADRQGTRGAFTTITVNSDGGYTEIDSNGEKYKFGPAAGENYASGLNVTSNKPAA